MTDVINYYKIKEEITHFLRNQDIMTTTIRGVTTATYTASLSNATTSLINSSTVRNIRSLSVSAVLLDYGDDYEIDFYYNDSGTRKCLLTFETAQTGDLNISYDYGNDKIYPDFPQTNLNISDFPRIGSDIVSVSTIPGGLGNVNRNSITFTVVVYETSKTNLLNYLTSVRTKFIDNQNNFYYLGRLIKPITTGPLLIHNTNDGKDKVFKQNIDFESPLKYEKN